MARRAILVLLLLLLPGSALAQSSWAVAERPGDQIVSLVSKLMPYVENVPGQKDAEAVILYAQMQYKLSKAVGNTEWCRNYVAEIRDPEALNGALAHPTFRSDWEVQTAHAFVQRGDKVTPLAETAKTIQKSTAENLRSSVSFDFGEVRKGDIIGWSVVGSVKGFPFGDHVPMADRFPVVIASVKINTDGAATYRLIGRGVEPKDIDFDEKDMVNSRSSYFGATMRALPAQDMTREQGPMPDTYPHVWFYQDEVYASARGPVPEGWASVTGWNLMAIFAHGMTEDAAKKTKGLDMVLGALTSGKTDAVAREEAIYKFVQEKIELQEGPEIERVDSRSPEEILKSRQASATEKAVLLSVMMKAADCPSSLAMLRSTEYGPLEESIQSILQFSDLVVRSGEGDSAPRFYAPQCTECAPGSLPAAWSGVPVFSAVPGMTEILEAFQKEMIAKFTTGTPPTPSELSSIREANSWFRMESTPTQP